MNPTLSNTVTELFLLLNVAIFWGFTAAAFLAPAWLAGCVDITLGSSTALADFRAMYGGLGLGVGELLLMGATRPAFQRQALVLAAAVSGGLAPGRLITLCTAGAAGPFIYASLASELFGATVGFWLLREPAHHPVAV